MLLNKKWIYFIGLIFSHYTYAQPTPCSTKPVSDEKLQLHAWYDNPHFLEDFYSQHQLLQAEARQYHCGVATEENVVYNIPLAFKVFLPTPNLDILNNSHHIPKIQDAEQAVNDINYLLQTNARGSSSFRFHFSSLEYKYHTAAFDDFESLDELHDAFPTEGTIPIYVIPTQKSGISHPSSNPTCIALSYRVLTNPIMLHVDENNVNQLHTTTLLHELGHFFGLHHTFRNESSYFLSEPISRGSAWNDECTRMRNCSSTGDLLCDTEADIYSSLPANYYQIINYSCEQNTEILSDCTPYPAYQLEMRNIMSYHPFRCRKEFSPMQIEVMTYTIAQLIEQNNWQHWYINNQWIEDPYEGDDYFDRRETTAHWQWMEINDQQRHSLHNNQIHQKIDSVDIIPIHILNGQQNHYINISAIQDCGILPYPTALKLQLYPISLLDSLEGCHIWEIEDRNRILNNFLLLEEHILLSPQSLTNKVEINHEIITSGDYFIRLSYNESFPQNELFYEIELEACYGQPTITMTEQLCGASSCEDIQLSYLQLNNSNAINVNWSLIEGPEEFHIEAANHFSNAVLEYECYQGWATVAAELHHIRCPTITVTQKIWLGQAMPISYEIMGEQQNSRSYCTHFPLTINAEAEGAIRFDLLYDNEIIATQNHGLFEIDEAIRNTSGLHHFQILAYSLACDIPQSQTINITLSDCATLQSDDDSWQLGNRLGQTHTIKLKPSQSISINRLRLETEHSSYEWELYDNYGRLVESGILRKNRELLKFQNILRSGVYHLKINLFKSIGHVQLLVQ